MVIYLSVFYEQYPEYLLGRINFTSSKWFDVCSMMHDTPFEYVIKFDENRADDGLYLRKYFLNDTEYPEEVFINEETFEEYPVTCLEVLIALVERICDEYVPYKNEYGEDMRGMILEAFFKNLGLYYDISEKRFKEKIAVWLDREYEDDGSGSIFPLYFYKKGFKKNEIWSQANIFLKENDIKSWEDFEQFL